jgi:hypothetical protein
MATIFLLFNRNKGFLKLVAAKKEKIVPSLSKTSIKWLNVVLDLNGILCVCQKRRLILKRQTYVDGLRPYYIIVSSLVRPKAIFILPTCMRFLRKVGNVVDITI